MKIWLTDCGQSTWLWVTIGATLARREELGTIPMVGSWLGEKNCINKLSHPLEEIFQFLYIFDQCLSFQYFVLAYCHYSSKNFLYFFTSIINRRICNGLSQR